MGKLIVTRTENARSWQGAIQYIPYLFEYHIHYFSDFSLKIRE